MADHAEEQQMEAEALEAIFENHFSILSPQKWSIDLYPEHSRDDCHVACRLHVNLPATYPELALPNLSIEIIAGLAQEHVDILTNIAQDEATNNEGSPSVFAIAERLREWLLENNVIGLDDQSMHAQMMRKKLQQENDLQKKQSNIVFESQKQDQVILTEAEHEELTVRQRRADGTPCNKENFEAWQKRFFMEQEATELQQRKLEMAANAKSGGGTTTAAGGGGDMDKSERMTGYDFFMSKAGGDLAALEAAAEEAENQELDEDLFKEEDDVDLDDLNFDDDEDDDDDDDDGDIDEDEEELGI